MSDITVGREHRKCLYRCISWSSVIAGGLVGLGLSFLLNLFGLAIGLTAFSSTPDGITALAIGGFLGLAIGSFAVMFVAGWTAGYLGRPYTFNPDNGFVYGFLAWCLSLLLLVSFANPLANFVASFPGSPYYDHNRDRAVVTRNYDQTPLATTDARNVTEKKANETGKAGLALFALFAIGALGSCFGGHFGMNYRKDDYSFDDDQNRVNRVNRVDPDRP